MKRFAVFFAVSLTVFRPVPANACDPSPRVIGLIAPADGQTGVPTNTRVWVGDAATSDGSGLQLLDASNAVVPTDESRLVGFAGSVRVLTPRAVLASGQKYSVVATHEPPRVLSTFVVGAEADTTAPPVPVFISSTAFTADEPLFDSAPGHGECGTSFSPSGANYVIDHEGVLAVASTDPTRSPLVGGHVDDLTTGHQLHVNGSPETEVTAFFGTFDLAGNFSGFSEPHSEKLHEAGTRLGCGCTATQPGGANAFAWSSLLIALAFRRRARSS